MNATLLLFLLWWAPPGKPVAGLPPEPLQAPRPAVRWARETERKPWRGHA